MNLSQHDWTSQLAEDTNAVILDVRTEEECNDGIIPNSVNIDIYKGQGFIYEIDALDKTKNYYVYCRAGSRSAQACNIMNQMGFEQTYNLEGGFMKWQGEVTFPQE
jgi:rhodanese-related sulfurtransferase